MGGNWKTSNKKLISVRINKDLLDKIEEIKQSENNKKMFKFEFTRTGRVYYFGGFTSTADVIEQALQFYFDNAPGCNTL